VNPACARQIALCPVAIFAAGAVRIEPCRSEQEVLLPAE
jgi:hypothetical protein